MGQEDIHNRNRRKAIRTALRSNTTSAEATFWTRVKKSKLGLKFRRQHGVGPFVLDFYCPEVRLAVELDGQVHEDEFRSLRDEQRAEYLRKHGITILRFENRVVFEGWEVIEKTILQKAEELRRGRICRR